jgi:EAL domain-containing protein (putative c-di-GMP-specific phosphodiesterase class I)
MQIESDLQRAIERQEFVLYYQPIFNLSTFQIEGFEALMRWHHPTAGVVSPANFIPVAENTGLIASLDIWALNQACQQLRQWQMQYPQLPLSVSVNLSGKQFMRPDLIPQIDRALVANEVSGRFLKIEITETVLIQNAQAAIELLRQLRQRHIQICMDDFGTGYSSLSYLHRFPIDILKIDKSFIDSLQAARQGDGTQDDGTQDNGTIVRAILNLAHNLNLQVVAEGIETLYQIHYLQSHRCHSGQGYFLAKPLPVSEVPDFLTNHA